MGGFLILIVVFGAAWLLFVLPARRRKMSHAAMQDSIAVGDEIISAGGLHGTITAIEDDTVKVEIATGVVATIGSGQAHLAADGGRSEREPYGDQQNDEEYCHKA